MIAAAQEVKRPASSRVGSLKLTHYGLFGIAAMERELSAIIGRRADVRTANLSPYFRDEVVRTARLEYPQ